ncbi:hypothetical protein [Asticcacaulis sp. 201]|uniref:hypothetical protein n=1 Tax=Asticcacaulis sp. 201 TaxID=3028787 RepID=UPI002916E396|nr:hypothetical protein [Asticcacaulis sp. 201]MDV6331418.1 hypothetical protein [Asticcacaulis sp. 201]
MRNTPVLVVTHYAEQAGIGMGRLNDGSVFLTQRGLARLCGVQNAHIGTISRDWLTTKPRILAIKARLQESGPAHRELIWMGHRLFAYEAETCRAILDYYALDAGDHIQAEAQTNRLRFLREDLAEFIRSQFVQPETPKSTPLRFTPLLRPEPESLQVVDAVIAYVCGLLALSAWLADTYIEGLKQRALNAPWNRLGLHLPLKAILEIQAEALLRINGTFTVK